MGYREIAQAGIFAVSALSQGRNKSTPPIANPYAGDPYAALRPMQQQNFESEAALQEQQAAIVQQEAQADAQAKAREVSRFQGQQALNYSSNGIQLAGSPLQVLEETRRLGQQEIDAIQRREAATSELLRSRAGIIRNEGRASLLGQDLGLESSRRQFDAQQELARRSQTGGGFLSLLSGAAGLLPSGYGAGGGTNFGSKALKFFRSGKKSYPLQQVGADPFGNQYFSSGPGGI